MRLPDDEDLAGTGPRSKEDRIILFIFCGLLGGLMAAEVLYDGSPQRLAIVFFLAFWVVLTVIHEGGHAIMAKMVGWDIDEIQLGFGRVVGEFQVGATPVRLRLFPIVGLVRITPTSLHFPRMKNMLVYAAGPGIELGLVALLTLVMGWDVMTTPTDAYTVILAQSFALAGLVGAGLNLIPFSPHPGAVTDGLGILLSPFLPLSHFETQMLTPALERGESLIEAGQFQAAIDFFDEGLAHYPHVAILRFGRAKAQIHLGEYSSALLEFQAYVHGLPDAQRAESQLKLDELRTYIEVVKSAP